MNNLKPHNIVVRALIGAVIGWTIGALFNTALAKVLKTLGDNKNLLLVEDKAVIQNFLDNDPFLSGIWDGRPETAREGKTIAEIAEETVAKMNEESATFSLFNGIKESAGKFGAQIRELINAREYRLLKEADAERAFPEDVLHPSQREQESSLDDFWDGKENYLANQAAVDEFNPTPTPEQSPEDAKKFGAF